MTAAVKESLAAQFHAMHMTIYGHNALEKPLEVVNFKLATVARLRKLTLTAHAVDALLPLVSAQKSTRRAYFADEGGWVDTPVYARTLLHPGHEIHGPAIIEQDDSTTVLVGGQIARTDAYGNLIVSPHDLKDMRQ